MHLVFWDFEEYLGVILPLDLGADNSAEYIGNMLENSVRARRATRLLSRGTPSSRLPPSTYDKLACSFVRPRDTVGSTAPASLLL